jgi:hypothetical protein
VRTSQPNFDELPEQNFDWCHSVYGTVEELIPKDAPPPLGNKVITVTYTDANLYHDMLTGRSVTGILHLCNQTLIDWYSKRQATVETATFGSEFTAARIAVDQIIDLRTTLRYLGVPVNDKSYMFGDNQSVVTNSTIPHSSLNKRHNALAYHRVRPLFGLQYLLYPRIIITLDLNVELLQFKRQIALADIRTFLCNVQKLPSGIPFTTFLHCNNKQQHNDPLRYCFIHNFWRKHRIDMISTREDVALYAISIAWV